MSNSKTRLGRGLGGLIAGAGYGPRPPASPAVPEKAIPKKAGSKKKKKKEHAEAKAPVKKAAAPSPAPPGAVGYREIAVRDIASNPYQPRREIDPAHIEELARSIQSEGLLQPIVVRPIKDKFEVVAGERRLRAFRHLGQKTIPARIIEASDASSATLALIENLQRENLNPVEEALGYASLLRDFDLTQEAAADRVGKGRATVANALRLLTLSSEIQGFISRRLLSTGHAKVLLGLDNEEHRRLLARRIIEGGMSVREAEVQVRRIRESSGSRPPFSRKVPESEATAVRDLERRIGSHLNTRVAVKHSPKKGRILIEYFGNDDLDRILEKLGIPG